MCKHEERRQRQRVRYRTNPKRRFSKYVDNARRKNIAFNLSFEEAWAMFLESCNYCGADADETTLNGIDRIDSNGIYELKNCVPCCQTCNMMKGILVRESFVEKCLQISDYHKKRGCTK